MGKQDNAPFKFVVRPITTVNTSSYDLAMAFEENVFASLENVEFSSPITGMAILPVIVDDTIAPPPPDSSHFFKKDNSVSVGIKIDFALWERSSELERLGLLADNIRRSLDKIQSCYLVDEDREQLRLIVDKVQALLVSRFPRH